MTPIVTRFAPSPTGRLHLGHAYSAWIGWRLAREAGGRWLLRIEDIDPSRCREEYVAGIEADLRWLGLDWDGPIVRQSTRMAAYAAALAALDEQGLLYPCFCTRTDIAHAAAAPHGPDGAIYPRTCRALPPAERTRRATADPYALRLDIAAAAARAGPLRWHDATAGWRVADPRAFGDVVLARKDVRTSYHLAVTVDDAAQGVTDVTRSVDLFTATDIHVLLQALLGLATPRYHHHALLNDARGKRLAKRDGAPALADLRAGANPAALLAEFGRHPGPRSTATTSQLHRYRSNLDSPSGRVIEKAR